MSPTGASLVATTISFAVFILYAVWYAAPWMSRRTLAVALSVPLWIHAFRNVALQVFSAQRSGFRIPDNLAQQIGICNDLLSSPATHFLRKPAVRSKPE
jgi:hypothetical protein